MPPKVADQKIRAIYDRNAPKGIAGSQTPDNEQREEIRRIAQMYANNKDERDLWLENYRQIYEAW